MPAVTGNIPADPSPPLQAVLWWLESLTSLEFEQLSLTMTDDYTHTILPYSLAQGGLKSKEEIMNRWKTNTQTFHDFSGVVHDIIESSNKIVIHGTSRADTSRGAYANEYVFHIRFAGRRWELEDQRMP
ncbi:hypothetical protein ABKN59_011476 [Abortiporus biennis]